MEDMTPILSQLGSTRENLLSVAGAVTAECWRERPKEEAWSAGEVIAHLLMVESRTLALAQKTLSSPPQRVPVWKRVHAPLAVSEWRGVKVKTPIPLDASLIGEKGAMLAKMGAVREETLRFLRENAGRDLSPYYYPHPFLGMLNLYDWFRVTAFHEARHTQQLREIVEIFQR